MSSPPDLDFTGAAERVAEVAVRTPLVPSIALSKRAGTDVYLKMETVQPTGSFKVRGAASKILNLTPAQQQRGVVTASTGNHGRAVAYVGSRLGIPVTVCVSAGVPPGKVGALRDLGATVEVVGNSQSEAMEKALSIAESDGVAFVHPFDDLDVIAGQGSIGLEIIEDLPDVATALVPLSGGGLMAGVASALSTAAPRAVPVGVSMERAPMMEMSLRAGEPVEVVEEETLADSLRGGIGLENRHSFRIVSDLVDKVVLIGEEAIWAGMRFLFEEHRLVVEGAAAVGVGALLSGALEDLPGPVVAVVSGANVEPEHLAALIRGDSAPTL